MARSYRFFVTDVKDFEVDVTLSGNVEPDVVEQLGKVLRAKVGDEVVLLPVGGVDGGGVEGRAARFEYVYEIASAHKKGVELTYVKKVENQNELNFGLELVVCLPNKPDKLSLILQKAVELGATRLVLVNGDFSQMKHGLREDRLVKIVKEAAEQAERATVPEVVIGGDLRDFVGDAPGGLLVAMERADNKSLPEVLKSVDAHVPISILIGPEGGFSDEEKALIEELGLTCFSLGKRVLRMETAAIVSLGMTALMR
ncbi:MAG: RsmE family RNA methyltransferase [Candidatus Gracilibacteria bacterium]